MLDLLTGTCVAGSVRPLPTASPVSLKRGGPRSVALFGSSLTCCRAWPLPLGSPAAPSISSMKCPVHCTYAEWQDSPGLIGYSGSICDNSSLPG